MPIRCQKPVYNEGVASYDSHLALHVETGSPPFFTDKKTGQTG